MGTPRAATLTEHLLYAGRPSGWSLRTSSRGWDCNLYLAKKEAEADRAYSPEIIKLVSNRGRI